MFCAWKTPTRQWIEYKIQAAALHVTNAAMSKIFVWVNLRIRNTYRIPLTFRCVPSECDMLAAIGLQQYYIEERLMRVQFYMQRVQPRTLVSVAWCLP